MLHTVIYEYIYIIIYIIIYISLYIYIIFPSDFRCTLTLLSSAQDLAADHDLQVSPPVAKTFKVMSWDDSGRPVDLLE
jgi:hypothetical protein